MLKKTITYTDYNGETRKEVFQFYLNRAEILEMEMATEGGIENMVNNIIATKDHNKIMQMFKEIILKAYGEKTPDGRRFIKSKEMSEAFYQSEAYSELIFELLSNPEKAKAFMEGIILQGIRDDMTDSSIVPVTPEISNASPTL